MNYITVFFKQHDFKDLVVDKGKRKMAGLMNCHRILSQKCTFSADLLTFSKH